MSCINNPLGLILVLFVFSYLVPISYYIGFCLYLWFNETYLERLNDILELCWTGEFVFSSFLSLFSIAMKATKTNVDLRRRFAGFEKRRHCYGVDQAWTLS
jgi:hypothetical protein